MKIQLYFRLTDDTNIPTLSQQPDYLILLTKSRWDDYGFKVTFDTQIIDYTITPPSIINLGAIKIGGNLFQIPFHLTNFLMIIFQKKRMIVHLIHYLLASFLYLNMTHTILI